MVFKSYSTYIYTEMTVLSCRSISATRRSLPNMVYLKSCKYKYIRKVGGTDKKRSRMLFYLVVFFLSI